MAVQMKHTLFSILVGVALVDRNIKNFQKIQINNETLLTNSQPTIYFSNSTLCVFPHSGMG